MALFGQLKTFDLAVDDFECWCETFDAYLKANKLDPANIVEDAAKKLVVNQCQALFIASIGLPAYTLLKNLLAPALPDTQTLEDLKKTLREHLKPAPKAIAERFRFMGRKQKQGETAAQYLAELRTLAAHCKFTDLDIRLRDQFIFGLSSETAQRHLFTKSDEMKLSDALKIVQAQEAADASTAMIRNSQPQTEQAVNKVSKPRSQKNQKGAYSGSSKKKAQHQKKNYSKGREQGQSTNAECPNCGSYTHTTAEDCPHKDVVCFKCEKKGHFAHKCRGKAKNAHLVDLDFVTTCNVVSQGRERSHSISIDVEVNGIETELEFDTGCETSMLSANFWRNDLGSPELLPPSCVFQTYTKEKFRPLGDLLATIKYNDQLVQCRIPVCEGASLFGRDLLKKIKLNWNDITKQCKTVTSTSSISVEALKEEFADVFRAPTAQDKIKNFKARIIMKDDAEPRFLKARPLPFAIRDQVHRELQAMEKQGVIEKIEHSDWASPIVVVKKPDGRVRITGDFKNTVNNQLCITQYPIAVPEDLFTLVSGCKVFSKLDGQIAYHQIELEDSSKQFLVINTPWGLFRYNVMPQGIAPAPAIFQEVMDKMLQGILKTGSYIDDCISGDASEAEHLPTLRRIFGRMREYNYHLSPKKCEIMKQSIDFLGHRISSDGVETSEEKVRAIRGIPAPTDVTKLKSFLGLVNFYCRFVANLADLCAPLYRLTQNGVEWAWTKQCQMAFNEVKKKLTSAPVLAHYDPRLPLGLSCDASSKGLGVVLFHRYPDKSERPIACGSKLLSATEQRYSQIEKEAYSIIFGVKKFYKYLCGRQFTLVTDQKPLLKIFGPKTQLPTFVATRLHGWSVTLSQFQYTVEYRKSEQHGNADALSRCAFTHEAEDDLTEVQVNLLVAENMEVLPVTAASIRLATAKDAVLSKVYLYTANGWPPCLPKEEIFLQPYFVRKTELTIVQGVLLWGIRVIIPKTLRERVLAHLHECHFGIVKMKSLARQHIWFPDIDADIEALCKNCTLCQQNMSNPASAPLHPWQFPSKPWQRLHIDLAGPTFGKMFLLVVDAHSKWPEVFIMNNDTTSFAVISKLMECFARFGLPEQVVSDNGRQFCSEEFQKFCHSNGIKHVRVSPYHPRSNGEAERFVQTFKRGMKATDLPLDLRLQRFLFQYRVTPHSTTTVSPAELLQGKKLRSILDLTKPNVQSTVALSQARQEEVYNKKVKDRQFVPNQDVWVKTYSKDQEKRSLGKIKEAVGPVTFIVDVNGRSHKRHSDQIRLAAQKATPPHDETDDESDFESPQQSPQQSPQRSARSTPQRSPRHEERQRSTAPCSPVVAAPPPPPPPASPSSSRRNPPRQTRKKVNYKEK